MSSLLKDAGLQKSFNLTRALSLNLCIGCHRASGGSISSWNNTSSVFSSSQLKCLLALLDIDESKDK